MKKETLVQLKNLAILDVADRLQIKYSSKGAWRKALCFCHDDHTPSLGINPAGNKWKCFSCGKKGGTIELVMEHEDLSYPDACEWLIREFDIPVIQSENRQSFINAIQSKLMNYSNANDANPSSLDPQLLERFKGTSNEFTRALVQNNILTPSQMQHACETFRLSTADDNVIFWQIDRSQTIREGKVMFYQADAHRSHSRKPVTMSWLLKQEKQLPDDWKARYCLFGLHQLSENDQRSTPNDKHSTLNDNRITPTTPIIAIVESEKTAIICSELIPTLNDTRVIWMATGGKSNLSRQALQPVQGYRVILFPDTDPVGETFNEWLNIAREASKQFGHSLTVSNLLEHHATEDQKKHKIDIADFIIESKNVL